MPLLTCPNDNTPMQALVRHGVELDMCSQCRGVWLDRGELEKILGEARAVDTDGPAAARREDPSAGQRAAYGERGESGERGDYDDRSGYGQRRKGRFNIFDVFD